METFDKLPLEVSMLQCVMLGLGSKLPVLLVNPQHIEKHGWFDANNDKIIEYGSKSFE
jgi:hypothetical protein